MSGADRDLVERLRSASADALPALPVAAAYLFGSRATGRTHAASDTDVAVLLSRPVDDTWRVRSAVAAALERAAGGEVDVVDLDEAVLALQGAVLRDRVLLYSADERRRVRWEARALTEYLDYRVKSVPLARALLARAASSG